MTYADVLRVTNPVIVPHTGTNGKLFLYAVLDNFGYRQLNTIYKVEAMAGYRKNKSSWGSIRRRTFSAGEKK